MNYPFRRKSIALISCYGLASVVAGGFATEALAQAPVPLRVDPVLLGLPPVEPAEPATRASSSGSGVERAPSGAAVEVQPITMPEVDSAVVDAPVAPAVPVHEPASPVAAEASGPVAGPVPNERGELAPSKREAVATDKVAPVVPAQVPAQAAARSAEARPARQVVSAPARARSLPGPAAAQSAPVSTLAPLRVDPALLGETSGTAGSSAGTPARVAARARAANPTLLAAAASSANGPGAARSRDDGKSWLARIWDPVSDVYDNGNLELYLPFHTHHLRSKYSAEKIASYQENPPGFGIGRGWYDEKGNWDGVYLMGFQDSHFKPMYVAGYGWKAIWRPAEDVRLGLGYTAGLMTRADIFGYVPFPIAVPMASVAYKNLSLESTFIPGAAGAGNIFFIWAKWEFGKSGEAVGTPRPAPPEPTQLANTAFGEATPITQRRVPYGPVVEGASDPLLATLPPTVAATGPRDAVSVSDKLSPVSHYASQSGSQSAGQVGLPSGNGDAAPTIITAERMGGTVEREFSAEGDAELRKADTVVTADRVTYWPVDDEVEAEGRVLLEQGEDRISGPKMRLKLDDQVGYFDQPSYFIKRQPLAGRPGTGAGVGGAGVTRTAPSVPMTDENYWSAGFEPPKTQAQLDGAGSARGATAARGDADRINFEGKSQVRMVNATYTTCGPGNDDWYAKASEIELDYDREVGEASDGTIYFKDVPILYSPWLTFSLNNQRKSGFLTPTFGTNSDSGFEFSQPYYWNIAPNMDATFTPRVMTKRGVQLNSEFRYLNTAFGGQYRGDVRAEVLPNDALRGGDSRYGLSLQHTQNLGNGLSGTINYSKVSDDDYYTDLSSGIAATSTTQLLQQATLSYGAGWWNAMANFQQYQTLQPDADNPVREPYRLLPQFTLNARKPDFYGADASFLGQYTHFTRPDQEINGVQYDGDGGQRTVLYPQLALPYVTPGWYVTPKLGVNATHYALTGQPVGTPGNINRTLPIVSVDSGMTFERPSNWFGRDYTQTLEPRLYYLNVPYQNQDDIPLFDTGLADFNFAQIFSENQFSSWDRISNANQLTAAATTRLLEPSTGSEVFRAMVGQRYYFTRNKVLLDATSATNEEKKWDKSDFLAAFSGQILPKVYADLAWQYNPATRKVKRYSMGAHYEPEPGKVLNASYRYNRDANAPIDQVDFSGQWPLGGRWHAVGRVNYSFKDDATVTSINSQGGRIIESLAGLEYNGGCWVVRGVVRRTALTSENASTAFFIQLELNDFSSIGSSPINLLKRNIQGYSLINRTAADPVFGE